MDPLSLVALPQTEEAYREWVDAHPHGFVINAWKEPAGRVDNAMMWHQVSCGHIDPRFSTPDPQFFYVTRDRLKACSANPAMLAMWAKARGEPLVYCEDCRGTWTKAHANQPV